MQAEDVEWGEDYRQGARQAVVELLEARMGTLIDEPLDAWPSLAGRIGATAAIAVTC